LLGFKQPFTAMGNSLFDTSVKNRFVYFYAGDLIGYVSKEGYIMHNYKSIVESQGTAQNIKNMQKNLFALDSAESGLMDKNKWAK
jgi:hypothetical protein